MIIDSHCHIDFDDFDRDREQVILRAQKAGIEHIILPAIAFKDWSRVRKTCVDHSLVHPAYGLHPYFLAQHRPEHLQQLDLWLLNESAVAVGECGLDYYLKDLDRSKQMEFFDAQLKMASRHQLPVIVHSRKATEDVINCIKKYPGLRGMIHSYSGSLEQALQLIKLGFYISFGGAITYDKATRIRAIAENIPLDALLIETDAPDQPDSSHHGERNEPVYILKVLESLAEIRNQPASTIAETTSRNAINLFKL